MLKGKSVISIYIFGGIAAIMILILYHRYNCTTQSENSPVVNPQYLESEQICSLEQLLALKPAELEGADLANVNLICARGLKGSEDIDIEACLKTLDTWAALIKEDTQSRLPSYYAHPEKYNHSDNLFKVVNMVLTLKEQIGVDYNQAIMEKTEFLDSRDFFIHGCLSGKKQGGCISIPVLCASIGRRLGYPIKLVLTRQHVFIRWDDGQEVFNVEACCPGCDTHPDEYYRKWPCELKDADIRMNAYLRSLTPAEELALFLQTRGHCLYDNGQVAEAQVMYAQAYKLMPDSLDILAHLNKTVNHEFKKFKQIAKEQNK